MPDSTARCSCHLLTMPTQKLLQDLTEKFSAEFENAIYSFFLFGGTSFWEFVVSVKCITIMIENIYW